MVGRANVDMVVIGRTTMDAVEELTSPKSIFVRVRYVYYARCERRMAGSVVGSELPNCQNGTCLVYCRHM